VYVYRGSSPNGPFTRITPAPVGPTSATDVVTTGTFSYLVRPVFLESNGSGSFYNLGQGAIAANVNVSAGTGGGDPGGGGGDPVGGGGGGDTTPPGNPPRLAIRKVTTTTIGLSITADPGKTVYVDISDGFSNWTQLGMITATGTAQEFELAIDTDQRIYRARY
jgi:hypothetical protein